MPSSTAYPVQVLRVHLGALEAAIATCLADPGIRPVHRLRTETRRVEALLFLLDLVPGLPKHKKQSARLRQVLRRLRRDAGEVRDLDVHRKMLEAFASAEDVSKGLKPEQAADPVPSAQTQPAVAHTEGDPLPADSSPQAALPDALATQASRLAATAELATTSELHQSALTLRHHMGRKRESAAAALQVTLQDHQRRAARSAQHLLEALKPGEDLPLPGTMLLQDAETLLTRDGLLRTNIGKLSRDELHTVRKAAKAARYVAESLPEDPAVAEAARRFEALQEAGGQWHDAWQLARAARHRFGKHHELTVLYRQERNRKLLDYREALRGGLSPRKKRKDMPKDNPDPGQPSPRAADLRPRRRPAPLAPSKPDSQALVENA